MSIKICWGYFVGNVWYPNKLLIMSPDEQYRQNVKNGFIKTIKEVSEL